MGGISRGLLIASLLEPRLRAVIRRSKWSCEISFSCVLFAEMPLSASSPAAHEGKIQRTSDSGARQRNQPPYPFLGRFRSQFRRQPFRDSRDNLFAKLFFCQILPVIDPRLGGGCFPDFDSMIGFVRFEPVQQSQPLNRSEEH